MGIDLAATDTADITVAMTPNQQFEAALMEAAEAIVSEIGRADASPTTLGGFAYARARENWGPRNGGIVPAGVNWGEMAKTFCLKALREMTAKSLVKTTDNSNVTFDTDLALIVGELMEAYAKQPHKNPHWLAGIPSSALNRVAEAWNGNNRPVPPPDEFMNWKDRAENLAKTWHDAHFGAEKK